MAGKPKARMRKQIAGACLRTLKGRRDPVAHANVTDARSWYESQQMKAAS
jgi:hypothetical protein